MKYYRVLPQCDDLRIVVRYKRIAYLCLVANELFTLRELEKMGIDPKTWKCFEPVDISKKSIYWFNNIRFAV